MRRWCGKSLVAKNLGGFHDLYLKTDVFLLADVFQNFRKTCLKNYSLDPATYLISPSLSWDALLKYTGVQLELLTDYDMHLFIEKGLRGGVSTEMRRYCKANNPYLSDYDPTKEKSYIQYYEANNLYGWAMSQPLPVRNFRWCNYGGANHETQSSPQRTTQFSQRIPSRPREYSNPPDD